MDEGEDNGSALVGDAMPTRCSPRFLRQTDGPRLLVRTSAEAEDERDDCAVAGLAKFVGVGRLFRETSGDDDARPFVGAVILSLLRNPPGLGDKGGRSLAKLSPSAHLRVASN